MSAARYSYVGLNLREQDAQAEHGAQTLIFGFWIFLMADLVVFALLFATYAAMSVHGVADGPAPAELFSLKMPFIETLVLLLSSFTFGMASLALKYSAKRSSLAAWLLVTGVLGAVFVAMEISDFATYISEDQAPPQRSGFLSAYYLLVGTHGVHVVSGLAWLLVLLVQLAVLGRVREVKLRLLRLALFWHMLDVVWVCIFTFVYLFGASA